MVSSVGCFERDGVWEGWRSGQRELEARAFAEMGQSWVSSCCAGKAAGVRVAEVISTL